MVIFSNAFKAVVSNQANVFSKTSSNVPTTQEESNKAMLFYDQEKVKLKQKKIKEFNGFLGGHFYKWKRRSGAVGRFLWGDWDVLV